SRRYRSGKRPVRRAFLLAVMLAFMLLGAGPASAQSAKDDTVRVTADQMHQLGVVQVAARPSRLEKFAVGQIAYNEDVSTVLLAPVAGRGTPPVARLGRPVPPA